MTLIKLSERLAKSYLSPTSARLLKRIAVYPRYYFQTLACRNAYRHHGHQYGQNILFIAGLPKSGTTWLEGMLSSYQGFHTLLIPEVTSYELATGGSHDYNLPTNFFSRFNNMLLVTKMHVHGSKHNVEILHKTGIKYVVMYRDLRDVAVSYFFYVRQTPWHPEHDLFAQLTLSEGLAVFAKRLLAAYADWIRSWYENRDPKMCLELRYENMLSDTNVSLARVAEHFGLDSSPRTVTNIVEMNSFNKLSGGRKPGKEDRISFFRKGIAGDWKNHFTRELKMLYKDIIGDFLIQFGYERDYLW